MTVDLLRRRQHWSRTSQHSMKTPHSSNQPNPGTAAGAPASSSSSSNPSTLGPQDSRQQRRAGTGSQTSAICHRVLHLRRAPLGRRRSSLTAAMARSRWRQGTQRGGQRGGTMCSSSRVRTHSAAAAAAVQLLRSVRYMCVLLQQQLQHNCCAGCASSVLTPAADAQR